MCHQFNGIHISNTLNKCKSSFNSRLNNHRKDFDNLKAVSACNHFQILDQNFIKHFKFTPQPWNLTSAFGSVLVNANSWFVVLFVDTWFDMLCLFLLVCQSRESVISNQMFCNNCCSLFTSFWLLFIHIAQKFLLSFNTKFQAFSLKRHRYADSSQTKVCIILNLKHFVSFIVVGILSFYLDRKGPLPATTKRHGVEFWSKPHYVYKQSCCLRDMNDRRSRPPIRNHVSFIGVTQPCVILGPGPENSAYTRRFLYDCVIMSSFPKDENCCCWCEINIYIKINIYVGKTVIFLPFYSQQWYAVAPFYWTIL